MRYLQSRKSLNHIVIQRRRYHLQVFQHLRKPEALRFIDLGRGRVVHVVKPNKSRRCVQIFVETGDCTLRTLQVSRISRHPPSIEIALEHFRTLDVIRGNDVVTVLVVEGKLIFGRRLKTGEVPVRRNVCKYLRADPGPETISARETPHSYERCARSARVCIPASVV